MSALDASDLLTLRYAARLPLLLAPWPSLSSELARTRPGSASHTSSPSAAAGPNAASASCTRCRDCGAETIGGLSGGGGAAGGAVWTEGARLVASCAACHRTTVRGEPRREARYGDGAGGGAGKAQFERVLKRRRTRRSEATQARRRRDEEEEVAHPTALLAQNRAKALTGVAAPLEATTARPAPAAPARKRKSFDLVEEERPPTITPAARSDPASSRKGAPTASTRTDSSSGSSPSSSGAVARAQPGTSSRPSPIPPSNSARSDSRTALPLRFAPSKPPSNRAPPLPSSATTKPAANATAASAEAKKRKRPKQPTGLAQLLAQKKEREAREAGQANGAGGLLDFLQEL